MVPKTTTTILLYLGLCVYRILNTFLIQSFFDPDEYWQTLEPAYCEVFARDNDQIHAKPQLFSSSSSPNLDCAGYTWEWKRRPPDLQSAPSLLKWIDQCLQGPIRSYLSILPTYIFYVILRKYQVDTHFWVSQGPKLVTATVAAATTDLAVWIMAHWLDSQACPSTKKKMQHQGNRNWPWWCLFCSVTSWFHGYALVRTFSNSLETVLLSVSIALVAPELHGNNTQSTKLMSNIRHAICFLLGGLSVAMRFSGVMAWIPMGILLGIFHAKSKADAGNQQSTRMMDWISSFLRYLLEICAFFGALGIAIACLVDKYFYGFWTLPFLGSLHFNVLQGNSSLYGSHPWHWYLTAGIPVITGLWLPFVLWDIRLLITSRAEEKFSSSYFARRNLWIIVAVYTWAHSMSGHKEFRFLMPILPLFCLLAGPHVQSFSFWIGQRWCCRRNRQTQNTATSATCIWPCILLMAFANLLAVLYLGLFHQSAPISVNHKISSMVEEATRRNQQLSSISRLFSVHYLTGGCHSTPLLSYLHMQQTAAGSRLVFDTWSLDCSPDCRSNPDILCESDRFAKDPVRFVEETYRMRDSTCTSTSPEHEDVLGGTCVGDDKVAQNSKLPPDFVVTFPDYAFQIQPQLDAMGLVEVGRYFHGINGIRLFELMKTGDGFGSTSKGAVDGLYRHVSLFGNAVELSLDEMVLFASSSEFGAAS